MRTTTIFAETHTSERANHVAYRLVRITDRYLAEFHDAELRHVLYQLVVM